MIPLFPDVYVPLTDNDYLCGQDPQDSDSHLMYFKNGILGRVHTCGTLVL